MPITIHCTQADLALPGHLALVGADLYAVGWRLLDTPTTKGLPALRQLPLPGGTRFGRYKLLLGAAAVGAVTLQVVPHMGIPTRLTVQLPAAVERPALVLALAAARGLVWCEVLGPYPVRVCIGLRRSTRGALAAAVASRPGSTPAQWVRAALAAGTK